MNKFKIGGAVLSVLAISSFAYSTLTPPSAPTNVTVNQKNGCNYITWTDTSNNEDGFILWKLDSDGNWSVSNSGLKKNWYYYNDCNIDSTKTYTYSVTSFNRAGASSFSNAAELRVISPIQQNPNFGGINDDSTIINNIQNNLTPSGNVTITQNPLYTTIGNISNGNTINNNFSPITNFQAFRRSNAMTLTWSDNLSPNYFEIYKKTSNSDWQKIGEADGRSRYYVENNCGNENYIYAIRAMNGAKNSNYSTRTFGNWVYTQVAAYAPAPVYTYSSSSYSSYAPAPVYTNGNITNFSANIENSFNDYSSVVLSWNYNGNNPNTYFLLERKTDGNDYETVTNIDATTNNSSYTYRTTINFNTNYTYRITAITNNYHSNSLTANISLAKTIPAPIVVNPTPVYSSSSSSTTCTDQGCNKCNGQEGCLPDFYFGKCYYDAQKDLLYVDICNGGSDYDFGYYSKVNFLYYYNNLAGQTNTFNFKNILGAGECQTQSFKVGTSYVKTNMSGPFMIKLQLDPQNQIQETNERNNDFVYTIR